MGFVVKVTTDNEVEVIQFNGDKTPDELLGMWSETVRTQFMAMFFGRYNVCMIVDEAGVLKENQKPNLFASMLYGVQFHGRVIYGDVIICGYSDDGIEALRSPFDLDLIHRACMEIKRASRND